MGRWLSLDFYRVSTLFLFSLTLFACSGGGGCAGCAGCGIQPIPGAYPLDQRIDNAAQVRLTSSGITFVEQNIQDIVATALPGGLDVPIDEQRINLGVNVTVCRGGGCAMRAEIDSVELNPVDPNEIRATLRLIVDSRDSAGVRAEIPARTLGIVRCGIDVDSRRGDRVSLGAEATIRLVGIAEDDPVRAARAGYTRLEVTDVQLADGEGIEEEDIELTGICSLLELNLIEENLIIPQIESQLSGLSDGLLGDQLCTTRGEFGCPTGTFAVPDEDPASVCRFEDSDEGECVPTLLGTDGRGDLGGALIGGFSPGTHAYSQFLLASAGDGEAVDEGMSLFFYGGFMGTDPTFTETPAHNPCVPVTTPPPLPTIARTEAFRGNVIPGTSTETHVGIGIAESFLDYAGWGLFDSGALCIGAGTRLSQQLSTGLVSAAIMSLPDLTYPLENTALTVAVRPQQAPDFTLGDGSDTSPFLQIDLPQVAIDFYVWSSERYVRFMTFTTDLDVGVNLAVEDNQLVPSIVGVTASNSTVTNSDLLSESPEALANVLETLIGSVAGMLGSALSPFDLPEIMGFALEVPDGGITPVTEGDERFLGIFANLALAGPMPFTQAVETRLEVSDLELHEASMRPESWGERRNSVWLHFDADAPAGAALEYSYRIDDGFWSPWTTRPRVRVDDEVLLLQARHRVEGRARVVGVPASVDPTPAEAELVVDILPPRVQLDRTVDGVEVAATDLVTEAERLEYRFQLGGVWTAWSSEAFLPLPTEASGVLVEVRDESGNVGRAEAPLIRGLPNPESGDGCGCRVAGADPPGAPWGDRKSVV